MEDSTFTDCALFLLAKADELHELMEPAMEPGFYASWHGALTVTRTVRGWSAQIAGSAMCSCCPDTDLVGTGEHANQAAALVRLGIELEEAIAQVRAGMREEAAA
jgi:hypothetical protein